jgi:hypothetical protein
MASGATLSLRISHFTFETLRKGTALFPGFPKNKCEKSSFGAFFYVIKHMSIVFATFVHS